MSFKCQLCLCDQVPPAQDEEKRHQMPVHCRYRKSGCESVFSQLRPQIRFQHEASCKYRTVTCFWTGNTCSEVAMISVEDHLMLEHGHLVFHVNQEDEDPVLLSDVIPMIHGETSWPDNIGCCGPDIIIIR